MEQRVNQGAVRTLVIVTLRIYSSPDSSVTGSGAEPWWTTSLMNESLREPAP